VIRNLKMTGGSYLGLFGRVGPGAYISNLGLEQAQIDGTGSCVGSLVGNNSGGTILGCFCTGSVVGQSVVGGLVGQSLWGLSVELDHVQAAMINCHSSAAVTGQFYVGGLLGFTTQAVTNCYSNGPVSGETDVGGLVGYRIRMLDTLIAGFWDIERSGQSVSAGGIGLTAAQMQDPNSYKDAGWDFAGRWEDGTSDIWEMPVTGGYPVLAVFNGHTPSHLQGQGTPEAPYLLHDALELGAVCHHDPRAHYHLVGPVDLSDIHWSTPVIPAFGGTFDGDGHALSHLAINGTGYLGLFGRLEEGAEIRSLALVDVNVVGSGDRVGGLAGCAQGKLIGCRVSGTISGTSYVGGLLGEHGRSEIVQCLNSASITGEGFVGGLLGYSLGTISHSRNTGPVEGNSYIGGLAGTSTAGIISNGRNEGSISGFSCVGGLVGRQGNTRILQSINTGSVTGEESAGGLVGWNENGTISQSIGAGPVSGEKAIGGLVGSHTYRDALISNCYCTGSVTGYDVAGLVGYNSSGKVLNCYSTGPVTGNGDYVGGLLALNYAHSAVLNSFWDISSSKQTTSAAGTGLETAQMQTAQTFLDAGWDFVGETDNGVDDIWWIDEGQDYPRLWWELEEHDATEDDLSGRP
jgi:hypothetical protein